MSILQANLERYSAMDLDPRAGLDRPSPGSPLAIGKQPADTEIEEPADTEIEEPGWKEDLCHAICVNNWSDTKAILDQHPNALTDAGISYRGRTALHVAAQFGNITIVKKLLELLPREFLLTVDSGGYTALAVACWTNGNTQIAKCLVNKNSDLVAIRDKYYFFPVTWAFRSGFKEMGRYLYSVTPLGCFTGLSGSKLLHFCLQEQCFDIALDLLRQCEELLFIPNGIDLNKNTPVHQIAILNTVILRPSELIFWKRWIYDYINIPSTTAINHVLVDIQQDRSQGDQAKLTEPGHGLLLRFIPSLDNFVGVKKIQELKLLHAQVDDLLLLVCKNARKAFNEGTVIHEALRLAAKEGNVEFVLQVSKVIPEILLKRLMVRCFTEALDYRQARVFNLIHGLLLNHGPVTRTLDDDKNTLLHKAAMKAPDHILNHIYVPTRMQRELQWFKLVLQVFETFPYEFHLLWRHTLSCLESFKGITKKVNLMGLGFESKEVESLMPMRFKASRNKNGLTAKELFRESHRELMKEGEKWIKDTASSCSFVGILIVTIMFAAAFTIPGGNDQNLGYPLLIKQPFFKVFIFSTIISFLSSSTSVLMFLAILTSHYSEEKFLKSLPKKLILGLSFLFISIVSMITTFLSTTYLMFNHTNYSWGILPIMILAGVPIVLFVLSQFPLLLHTYVSTYGNLFDRKGTP